MPTRLVEAGIPFRVHLGRGQCHSYFWPDLVMVFASQLVYAIVDFFYVNIEFVLHVCYELGECIV